MGEHISTKQAVNYVLSSPPNLGATITCHHLLYNRNSLLVGGIKPHFYCLPILKRETHRLALLEAATSGNPKFFLGTDSAPHTISSKQSGCGCAGIFTAHCAVELYAEAFERMNALDKLENFTSVYGARFMVYLLIKLTLFWKRKIGSYPILISLIMNLLDHCVLVRLFHGLLLMNDMM